MIIFYLFFPRQYIPRWNYGSVLLATPLPFVAYHTSLSVACLDKALKAEHYQFLSFHRGKCPLTMQHNRYISDTKYRHFLHIKCRAL